MNRSRKGSKSRIGWIILIFITSVIWPPIETSSSEEVLMEPLWGFHTKGGFQHKNVVKTVVSIDDIDGDGLSDVIAGGMDEHIYALSGLDGSPIWIRDVGSPVYLVRPVKLGDTQLVVFRSTNKLEAVLAENGSTIWERTVDTPGPSIPVEAMILLSDFDEDGISDLAVGSFSGTLYVLSASNGHIIWQNAPLNESIRSIIPISDLDGDGLAEIAVCYITYILALRGANGSQLWRSPLPIRGFTSMTYLSDGSLIVGRTSMRARPGFTMAVDVHTGTELWRLNKSAWFVRTLDDVDNDGINEVVISDWDESFVRLLSGRNGLELWKLAMKYHPEPLITSRDLNGDGISDIVVGTGGAGVGDVFLIDGKRGQIIWKYEGSKYESKEALSDISQLAYIADVNGDNIADILATTYDGNVYLLSGRRTISSISVTTTKTISEIISVTLPEIELKMLISFSIIGVFPLILVKYHKKMRGKKREL